MKYAGTGLMIIMEDEYRFEILVQIVVSIYRGEYSQSCLKYGAGSVMVRDASQPVDTESTVRV